MLGFLPPVFGFLPRSCEPNGPGGPGAGGEAVGGESAGGDSNDGGVGGDGEPLGDRVVEPLLGCVNGVSGKETPGVFNLIETYYDIGQPEDQVWLTDWSGDGQTAVGVHTNPPFEEAYGAFFVSWSASGGWSLNSKVRVELSQFNEPPTARVNCDGSVRLTLDGDGSVSSNNSGLSVYNADHLPPYHRDLVLSEDGTAYSYNALVSEGVRPWAAWRDQNGNERGMTLESVYSLSWDGLTAFGLSSCYYYSCIPPKTYTWRPLDGGQDITTTAPTPYVAADGETVVYNYNETHLGIWTEESIRVIDCVDACHAVAWSATAKVLLVDRNGTFEIWTEPHGFRPLADLINVPPETLIVPDTLSLDGWTVAGSASTPTAAYANFRATLKADAFQ